MALPPRDEALAAALAASHLARIPDKPLAELLDGATRLRVPGGSVIRSAGEAGAYLLLVVDGIVRVSLRAPDGRSLTIRYCRQGALMGTVSLFPPAYLLGATMQSVVESELLVLRPSVAQRLAAEHPEVARAFLDDLSERVIRFVAEIPGSVFATVRQRVARHLLDLAAEAPAGPRLVAHVRQQELADAVGTAREVAARILRDLRVEGIVATGRDGIAILDPARLHEETYAPPAPDRLDAPEEPPRPV
jgi:CRP/FNR family transcriptional regulator